MSQRFLLSAAARTLSLKEVTDLTDAEARATFQAVRFADNEGKPMCPDPKCACRVAYEMSCRDIFKCTMCERQFSLTSGTIFDNQKMGFSKMLIAILLFVNGVNGYSASKISRDVGLSYKSAWVLLQKFRKAMAAMQDASPLTGEVEADGVWMDSPVRRLNLVADREKRQAAIRKARRDAKVNKEEFFHPDKDPEKEVCIVTFRERRRGGRSRSFVFRREHLAVPYVGQIVNKKAKLITDAGSHWAQLDLDFDRDEVNHSIGYLVDGVHINGVESFHSRIRRGQRGVYLRLAGRHLQNYADEFSWRDDHRRVSNGQQFRKVLGAAATLPIAPEWVGLWQKRPKLAA